MSLKNSLFEKNYRLTFWLCVLGLMWITAFLATAEETPQKADASDTTSADGDVIDGTADDFERYEKKGITILIGHVKINMPAGFLNSDKATLHEDIETGDIVKTVAEGNVELRDGEALATCDYAIIYHLDDIIDLQHNVVVTQNEDKLTAKHVIYERRVGKQISEGTVKINRPDGFLNGDKVTMFRNIETNELLQTLAEGNVELRDKEIFATCDHATINHTDETVNLRENVVVIQNKDRLETKHFTYNQKTGEQIGKGDVKFKVRVKRSKKADETSEKSESEGEDKK
jgi:lipopolysaccharide export system protein LptA